jgi:hypothetical protein
MVRFGFIHKILITLKKWVMAIIAKDVKQKQDATPVQLETELDKEELEYLFELIKRSNFPGTDLQLIYKIIIKLQNQYLSKK